MMLNEVIPSLKRLIIAASVLLSACGGSDVSDLERFVSDKTERAGGFIEPIPTFTAYEAFAYSRKACAHLLIALWKLFSSQHFVSNPR